MASTSAKQHPKTIIHALSGLSIMNDANGKRRRKYQVMNPVKCAMNWHYTAVKRPRANTKNKKIQKKEPKCSTSSMKGHLFRIPIQTRTETEETKKISDRNPISCEWTLWTTCVLTGRMSGHSREALHRGVPGRQRAKNVFGYTTKTRFQTDGSLVIFWF